MEWMEMLMMTLLLHFTGILPEAKIYATYNEHTDVTLKENCNCVSQVHSNPVITNRRERPKIRY